MATTTRGVPYPADTDPNDVPADLQALASWVNDSPGVAALTTTQRDALAGAALWDGRVVLNVTTDQLERYDAGGAVWVKLVDDYAAVFAAAAHVHDSRYYTESEVDAALATKLPLARRRAKVGRSANVSLVTATTTILEFNTEDYDTDNLHDNATNNSRVLLNRLGVWLLVGQAGFGGSAAGRRVVTAHRNGTEIARGPVLYPDAATQVATQVVTPVVATATTDYVELAAYQDSGGNLWCGAGDTFLAVVYLGE